MSKKDIRELLAESMHSSNDNEEIEIDYMDSDIIFIEKLESLPSAYSGKLSANIICVCGKGRMQLDVNGTHYVIREGETLVCPSGVIVDNLLVSPDFKFTVLCMTDRIIQSMLNTNVDIWNRAVYVRREHVVKPVSDKRHDQMTLGWHFMSILHKLLDVKENPFREEMVRSMLQIVLLGFCARQKEIEMQENIVFPQEGRSPQRHMLFTKFMELLREEPMKHKPVYYYATKLGISSKYLSHVCKEMTGKSANEFIQNAVVDEIVHYLKNTSMSVKEMSMKMGFPNLSFFGKYVKSHLGVSPNEYRKQLYTQKI